MKVSGAADTRFRPSVWSLFTLDMRALAVVRIGLGGFLALGCVTDLIHRPDRVSDGVDLLWVDLLLLPLAILLAAGMWTRFVTVGSWLLFSHELRENFFDPGGVIPLGNYVLSLVLLWGMFLPLGARASLDSRKNDPVDTGHLSVAGIGLLLQVALIYISAGLTKDYGEWLFDRTALFDLMSHPLQATYIGSQLTQLPKLLELLSVATVALEVVGPIVLFIPGRGYAKRRAIIVFLFMVFHVALATVMNLGVFPYVMLIIWLVFLPQSFWDHVWDRHRSTAKLDLELGWIDLIPATLIAIIIVSNVVTWLAFPAASGLPQTFQTLAKYLVLYQQWVMYSVPSTI